MKKTKKNIDRCSDSIEPVHMLFNLSYAHYLVLARSGIQSMPPEWQKRFVQCVEEYFDVVEEYKYLKLPDGLNYNVTLKDGHNRFVSINKDPLCDYERGRRDVFKL